METQVLYRVIGKIGDLEDCLFESYDVNEATTELNYYKQENVSMPLFENIRIDKNIVGDA